MDRQDVEYIEREDDEEFDEFGRKKKRRKLTEEVSNSQRRRESPFAYRYLQTCIVIFIAPSLISVIARLSQYLIGDFYDLVQSQEAFSKAETSAAEEMEEDEDDEISAPNKYNLDESSEEDEGDEELDKYDLTADPELSDIKIDILKFKGTHGETADKREGSVVSSE